MAGEYLLIRKDSLECPVCLKSEVDAFSVFPCGHSVCRRCSAKISRQLKSNSTRELFYECPICYHQVFLRKSRRLPRNFAVQNLLDSAVPLTKAKVSLRKQKQLSNGKVAKKAEAQQLDRFSEIAEQRDKIERLEMANTELQAGTKRLHRTAWFAFALATIFLATAVNVATTVWKDEIPWCPEPIDTEPKSGWQRFLDFLLLRETNHQPEMVIIGLVRALDILSTIYRFYIYVY